MPFQARTGKTRGKRQAQMRQTRHRWVQATETHFVATVVPARFLSMVLPVSHTKPAKFVPASSDVFVAGHMVATLIFLDWFSTFRTLLGVGNNPCHVLTLGRIFFGPSKKHFGARMF